MVGGDSASGGTVVALDNPARQSFVIELVGAERVVNAVSLNSVIVHCARMIGPAIAGVLIAIVGVEPCFLLNAASFAAMLVALRRMDPAELTVVERGPRGPRALRDGVSYVARTPKLAVPLAMMALVGTLGFNFQVLLPLLARFSFEGGPGTYAALVVAMGAGSVLGALTSGARNRVSSRLLIGSSAAFGVFTMFAVAAPTLTLEVIALALVGAASVTFAAGVNSTLQLEVEPAMRGRVMALYSVVFLGSTPIGAPVAGWLSDLAGPRAGLALGGTAALTAAVGAALVLRHRRARADDNPLKDISMSNPFKRKSRVERLIEPLGELAKASKPGFTAAGDLAKAGKPGLVAAGGIVGLAAGSAIVSSLRQRTTPDDDDS